VKEAHELRKDCIKDNDSLREELVKERKDNENLNEELQEERGRREAAEKELAYWTKGEGLQNELCSVGKEVRRYGVCFLSNQYPWYYQRCADTIPYTSGYN